ncbi:MAG: hypothetical protein OXI52_09065 [Caldilineaceae bacterium]|nr:hypothetical protein [Caldilineaceae bacterium]
MEAGNLNKTGGLTIAKQHAAVGVYLEEADDDRFTGKHSTTVSAIQSSSVARNTPLTVE